MGIVDRIVRTLLKNAGRPGTIRGLEREKTCVVLALEGAIGAKVPKGVRQRRARDIYSTLFEVVNSDVHTAIKTGNPEAGSQMSRLQENPLEFELPNITALVRDIRRSKTTMGRILKERPFRVSAVTRSDIKDALKKGENVIVVGRGTDNRNNSEFCHAANLTMQNGRLRDTVLDVPVKLPIEGRVAAIIFAKKNK